MSEYFNLGPENIIKKGWSNYPFTKNYEHLFYDGAKFFQDTEQLILSDSSCAEYFLTQIQTKEFYVSNNNALSTILKLHDKVKTSYSKYSTLKPLFIQSMKYIEQNISQVTGEKFLTNDEIGEDLSLLYSYSPYSLLAGALPIVRHRALAEYIRALAKHLKKLPDITDLWGGNYLVISNVKLEGVTDGFGEMKLNHSKFTLATFTRLSDATWKFEFNNLGPENNFIYMQNAYRGVADLLAYSLCADVELCTWLDD